MRPFPRMLVLSCEHAGNRVPARYRHLFQDSPGVLETHRAYDLGVYPMARMLARRLDCPLFAFFITRLLIDANRSVGHRNLLSEYSRELPALDKQRLIRTYHQPYRENVTKAVERPVAEGREVLHVSLHSFAPVMGERPRNADIGVLYDSKRPVEMHLAELLQTSLVAGTGLRVRRNYPYRGASDGLTTFLRRQFADNSYVGLEIELNQRLLVQKPPGSIRLYAKDLAGILSEGLMQLLHTGSGATVHGRSSDIHVRAKSEGGDEP